MKLGCVILAGGQSARMGCDKALLELEGQQFVKKIAEELVLFDEKIIARGNNNRINIPGWKEIVDVYPNHGPLGGMHAALQMCESQALFCISVDMPLIKDELIKKMCSEFDDTVEAVVAVSEDGKVHPLCGIYRKELYQLMEKCLLKDENKLMRMLAACRVRYMYLDADESGQLMNINTKKEYERLR